MQQEQYYKAVPVSEKPKADGLYFCKVQYKHIPEGFLANESVAFIGGEWIINKGEVIEWLEPIQLPDAQVLREALEKIANHDKEAETLFPSITVDMFKHIATEALSAGDGWVRVEGWNKDGNVLIAYRFGVGEAKRVDGTYYKPGTWIEFPEVTHVKPLPSLPKK